MNAPNQKQRFKITPFTNHSGSESHRVTGIKRDGSRIRENFTDYAKALTRQQELERDYHGLLKDASLRTVATRLTPEQVADAEAAIRLLVGVERLKGKTLVNAVEYFRDTYREPVNKMPLCCGDAEKPDAFKLFIEAKRKDGRRPDTIRNLSDRVGRFCKQHPEKLVSDIAQQDIETFIDSGKKGYYGKQTDRLALSSFFSWCASKKFCVSNPAQHVPKVKHDKPEPQIIPLDRVRRLVDAAMKFKKGVCMPYVALGLFCAIRPREISRLSWSNIDLEDGTITIDAAAAKKRQKRVVAIPDNAVEFLLKHATKRTPLVGKNWRRDFRAIKKQSGYGTPDAKNKNLIPYPADAMRHTGISHHLAAHENETKTAAWAGNSPDVIHTSYKALVKPKEAADFWAITPKAVKRKIVRL